MKLKSLLQQIIREAYKHSDFYEDDVRKAVDFKMYQWDTLPGHWPEKPRQGPYGYSPGDHVYQFEAGGKQYFVEYIWHYPITSYGFRLTELREIVDKDAEFRAAVEKRKAEGKPINRVKDWWGSDHKERGEPTWYTKPATSVPLSAKSPIVKAILEAKSKFNIETIFLIDEDKENTSLWEAVGEELTRKLSAGSSFGTYKNFKSVYRVTDGPIIPFVQKIGNTNYTVVGEPTDKKEIIRIAKGISIFDRSPVDNKTPWERYIAAVKSGDKEKIEWEYQSIFEDERIYDILDEFDLVVNDPQGNPIYGEEYADRYKV